MLISTAATISSSLANLFNLYLSSGSFPSSWKLANVVPLSKLASLCQSPLNSDQYHCCLLLVNCSKNIIHYLISAHLSIHHPLSNLQWGFQERKSTVTALLSVTQDWFANLDKHKEICCVFRFQKGIRFCVA